MTADTSSSDAPALARKLGLAEEALRASEARYRALFDMAAAGITRIGLDGRLLEVNSRACEILGRSREELVGQRSQDFTHADDLASDRAVQQELAEGRISRYTREKRYLRPDGSTVWTIVSVTLLGDDLAHPDHFICVIEDITERKRYQDAMITTQAAERANRAKSEFLSRMSHELRTPLNAMLGFAQLLRVDTSQPLSATQRTKIEHIERAGSHLLAMITDVLDLSRIEAGGLPLSIEPVSLQQVVEDAINLVAAGARATGIQLQVEPLAPEWHARADRVRLRQVLTNLLSNAVKYNLPGGSVKLRAWLEKMPDGDRLHLSVTDTGIGLSAEQQTHLFEPFNRLGAERSGVEGSGIGLVIVRRLLELMGGSVGVLSQVGRGSCFTVTVPATASPSLTVRAPRGEGAAAAEALDDWVEPAPEEAPAVHDGVRGFTVLYAEDNEVNVELVRQVMRMRPAYRLIVAHSGAQAIELTRAELPDVLLLDMHLGDMSGLDVVAALEHDPATASIPRLALSADALPDQIRAAKERGFKVYLTKPLDVGALLRSLDEYGASADAEAG